MSRYQQGKETETGVQETARLQFEEQLESWLLESETKEVLQVVAEENPELTTDAVRDAVLQRWSDLRTQLKTALNRWEKASRKLVGAEQAVEEKVSRKRLRWTGRLTLAALILAFGAILWLALTKDLQLLFALYLVPVLPLYWLILKTKRDTAAIEHSIPIRTLALATAEERFRSALNDQISVAIREAINSPLISFERKFRLYDQRGLRELADPEREVSTRSSKALGELLGSLDSGSVGLAGPRGCGKTTLIGSFAHGRSVPFEKERVGLVVSAPVKYDAKEFVLHLFGSLCRQVVGEDDLEEVKQGWRSLDRRRQAGIAAFGMYAGGLLFLAGVAMLVFDRTKPEGPQETGLTLLAVGFAIAYVALLLRQAYDPGFARITAKIFTLGLYKEDEEQRRPPQSPEQVALERLEEIGFQQSVSSGWSAGMKLPFGLSLGGDSSMTTARTPWSLPEAVEEFRRFASSQFEGRYVVIGIDELDKMESDEAARKFLNDVKGVFGVRNCYFLVSVSEEAMSTFERRGLPFRDVFDSSFDAIQTVGYLTLEESRAVLESRVIGLPIPFQCLCHALAGGLPRDLIRVTRELVQQSGPESTIADLSLSLIGNEHRRKVAAAIAAARGAAWPHRDWIVAWLNRQQRGQVSPGGLRDWVRELEEKRDFLTAEQESEAGRECRDAALQIACFDYFAATVIELFGLAGIDRILRRATVATLDPDGALPVETLAVARQQFGISSSLAWERVDRVRWMTNCEQWPDLGPLTQTVTA